MNADIACTKQAKLTCTIDGEACPKTPEFNTFPTQVTNNKDNLNDLPVPASARLLKVLQLGELRMH